MNWRKFSEGHPQLGMTIEVRTDKGVTSAGKVERLWDIGGGWVSITTDHYVNMAVRPSYEWRQAG